MNIIYHPIGYAKSPLKDPKNAPIQSKSASEIEGEIIVAKQYQEGLKDLDLFSHIIVLYHFHKAKQVSLLSTPFMDDQEHGIFAIRGPNRPNPIGLSTLIIKEIHENRIIVSNIDLLDGTPILDIKPYSTVFDHFDHVNNGWLTGKETVVKNKRSDDRFTE